MRDLDRQALIDMLKMGCPAVAMLGALSQIMSEGSGTEKRVAAVIEEAIIKLNESTH